MDSDDYKCGYTDQVAFCKKEIPKKRKNSYRIILGKNIDRGANGTIDMINVDGDDKILKITRSTHEDVFSLELCNQHIVSLEGLAPRIYDYWFCGDEEKKFVKKVNGHGAVIMDYAGNITLKNFIDEKSQIRISTLNDIIDALQIYNALFCLYIYIYLLNYKLEIFHLDLHLSNIMVTVDNNRKLLDMKFIDFGNSRNFTDVKNALDENIINHQNESKFVYIGQYFNTLMGDILMSMSFFKDRYVSKLESELQVQTNLISEVVFEFFVVKTVFNKIITPNLNPFGGFYNEDDFDEIESEFDITLDDIVDNLKERYPDIVNTDNEDLIKGKVKIPKSIRRSIKNVLKKKENKL
jgi:hypothetical protein